MSVANAHHPRLAEVLLKEGVINRDQYQRALEEYDRTSRSLVRILTEMGLLEEKVRIDILRKTCDCEYVRLHNVVPSSEVSSYLNQEMCYRIHVVPIRFEGSSVLIAMEDPTDMRTITDVEMLFGRSVKPVLATAEDIENTIRRLPEQVDEHISTKVPTLKFRFLSNIVLSIIVFVPLVGFYFFVNIIPAGVTFFESLGFSRFETILLYVVTWSSWAAIAYFLHDLLFGSPQN